MTRPAGRFRRFVGNITGRVGSGQEAFKYQGSGRATLTRSDPREEIRLVKSPVIYHPRCDARHHAHAIITSGLLISKTLQADGSRALHEVGRPMGIKS